VPVQAVKTIEAKENSPEFTTQADDVLELKNDNSSETISILSVGEENLTIGIENETYEFQAGQTRYFHGIGLRLDSIKNGKGVFTLMTESDRNVPATEAPSPIQQDGIQASTGSVKNRSAKEIVAVPALGTSKKTGYILAAAIFGMIGLISLLLFRKGAYGFSDLKRKIMK
jgi:hypothetical protein